MAKVAFQFARLYSQAYRDNKATNELLTDFEKELDEIVIKIWNDALWHCCAVR